MPDSNTYISKARQHIAALAQRQSKTDGVLGSLAIATALVAIAERLAPLEVPEVTPNLVMPACSACGGMGTFDDRDPPWFARDPLMTCTTCEGTGMADIVTAPPKPKPEPPKPESLGPYDDSVARRNALRAYNDRC